MQYPICRHVKTNGARCGSPALTGSQWCYYHGRLHQKHSMYRYSDTTRGYLTAGEIELTAIEDADSIQLALSIVLNALATGEVETKRATALLYGLQLASLHNHRRNAASNPPDMVRTIESTPDGLDLAQSETAATTSPDTSKSDQPSQPDA